MVFSHSVNLAYLRTEKNTDLEGIVISDELGTVVT